MKLHRIFFQTESALMPHEETYRRRGQAGVYPYAVIAHVVQKVDLTALRSAATLLAPDDLGQSMLEYAAEDLNIDLSQLGVGLYTAMSAAMYDLHETLRQQLVSFTATLPTQTVVLSLSQPTLNEADLMIVIEVSDRVAPNYRLPPHMPTLPIFDLVKLGNGEAIRA